ncbi:ABC transporter ATP-binding protein [Candidatus Omnitrophota bacterium]
MKDLLIRTEKLTKTYILPAERIDAVKDITVDINEGDFIAVMGPSGSGKTTFLDIIGCLDSISSGKLEFLGKDVSRVKESRLVNVRRGQMGFIFQEFLLIPSLTALENVELPLIFTGKSREKRKSIEILEKVGLGNRINHLPKELSGGERQRVAIARALITSPKILLADEPTGNLDTKNSQEIYNLFKQLNREENLTIIVATHDNKLGSQASRIINLKDGQIVEG